MSNCLSGSNEKETPFISVIIVNWNGSSVLNQCLHSLAAQSFTDFEILIVDNGSTDDSLVGVETYWPRVRIERLSKNLGFAKANNIGVRLASGQWVALLNNDAFPEKDWLSHLVSAIKKYPEFSFFASCLLKADTPEEIDGMGDVYHISGIAWRKAHGKLYKKTRQQPAEVFGACGAAAFFPRSLFLDVGGFDEDFFCYHEDVDLSFRLRLYGHRCLYVPEAVVRHVGSSSHGAHSDTVVYYGHRNLIWCYCKNMPNPFFGLYLPVHLLLNLISLIWFTLRGQGRSIFRAKRDAIQNLIVFFDKRRVLQSKRKANSFSIIKKMDHSWLNPYLGPRWRQEKKWTNKTYQFSLFSIKL